jgi:hypothetical protein
MAAIERVPTAISDRIEPDLVQIRLEMTVDPRVTHGLVGAPVSTSPEHALADQVHTAIMEPRHTLTIPQAGEVEVWRFHCYLRSEA